MSNRASDRSDKIALWLLAACALVIVALTIRREFARDESFGVRLEGARFEESLIEAEASVELAKPDGTVRIVEFVDLECSACAFYHEKVVRPFLDEVETRREDVSFRVVLLPLPIHPHAEAGAVAAACSEEQGRFGEYLSIALAGQSSFGEAPWGRFAEAADLQDIQQFLSCLTASEPPSLVVAGKKLAESAGVRATPTLAVNGWILPRPVTIDELRRIVDTFLEGSDPFR